MTIQILNLISAASGALAGLAIVPQLSGETVPAAFAAALLVLYLSWSKHQRPLTLALCGVLGFACTRLTVSLVS